MRVALAARGTSCGLAVAAVLAAGCGSPRSVPPLVVSPYAPHPTGDIVVAAGETTCAFAGRVGVDVAALRAANGLAEPAAAPLAVGRLRVPPDTALRHRIRSGETLQALAGWYGHPIDILASKNAIADPDRIIAGTWLEIPPGARTGCPPPEPVLVRAPPPRPVAARSAPRAVPREARPRTEPPPAAPAPPRAELGRADTLLAEAERRYQAADFEATLALVGDARRALPPAARDPESVERRARASWLAGLANAGLDRRDAAVAALREALALQPSLRQDERLSPRILGLLETPGEPEP